MLTSIEDANRFCDDPMLHSSEIYVLSGFSGAGKGTLCERIANMAINGKPVAVIRSVTSREPRSENENYTFVTGEVFSELVKQNRLLEYNSDYGKAGYGTPVWDVLKAIRDGYTPLLEIDRTGLCSLLTQGKVNPVLIRSAFIAAPAVEVAKRLYLRGTESGEAITHRLKTAVEEANWLHLYDAVVVNQNIDQAVADTVRVLEGTPSDSSFDSNRFQVEMQNILSDWSKWIETWRSEMHTENESRRNAHAN